MAVQQNKPTRSKRGMRLSHDALSATRFLLTKPLVKLICATM